MQTESTVIVNPELAAAADAETTGSTMRSANVMIGVAVALALAAPLLNIVATPVRILDQTGAAGLSALAIACILAAIVWRRDQRVGARVLCGLVFGWTAFFLYGFLWLSQLPPPGPAFAAARCPDFSLRDADGASVALADMLRNGPVLLVFYPSTRDLTSLAQLRELATLDDALRRRSVQVLAISADMPSRTRIIAAANHLPFPLLSDTSCEFIGALGLRNAGAGESRTITSSQVGPTKSDVSLPAVMLVDRDGSIRWRYASSRVQYRPAPAELLAAVDRLAK